MNRPENSKPEADVSTGFTRRLCDKKFVLCDTKVCLWFVFAISFFIAAACHSEFIPGFNIHECVGKAELITVGSLDSTGRLIVTEDLLGTRDSGALQLRDGQAIYQKLSNAMQLSWNRSKWLHSYEKERKKSGTL